MSENKIKLKVVTPDGVFWDKETSSVNLKTTMGEITIMPKHIPLIATLENGVIRVFYQNKEYRAELSDGVVEVKKNSEVIIISKHSTHFFESDN